MSLLRRLHSDEVMPLSVGRDPVHAETLREAMTIIEDVRRGGEQALRKHAERLGDVRPGQPLWIDRPALDAALFQLPVEEQAMLLRTAERIRAFAEAQRRCLTELSIAVPGGMAGHQVAPVERAGCYAPGGRFPLPSSVLMTAICARVAGVKTVVVASPRPAAITLAAAAAAGADMLLAVGGAQAIAALAYGVGSFAPCDAVVGPGNRWVTAAKQVVAGRVTIDMLAGPSELLVLADGSADPALIAADLLAQAEHDPEAMPVLVSLDEGLVQKVEVELESQLDDLARTDEGGPATVETARAALRNGFAVVAKDLDMAVSLCDRLAPEHLEVVLAQSEEAVQRLSHYGALFIGPRSAEVFGDYGVGPNHVLPTGGTARSYGGLSVLTFLRVRTWLRLDRVPADLRDDTIALARAEGLLFHARAAERRREG